MRIASLLPRAAGARAVAGRLAFAWRRERKGVEPQAPEPGRALSLTGLMAAAGIGGRSYGALARDGFMRNPVAHRCLRLVSESAAAVPLLLYEGESELPDHPLIRLLARPNPRMSGADLFETLYGHLLLSGNAYVEPVTISGRLRALYPLRPDRIGVTLGPDGWPEAYDYRTGSLSRRFAAEPEEGGPGLLHLKLFHPLDDHMGFAPLAAAGAALDLSNAASAWNKALIDNSARPSGALVFQPREGGNLSPDQFERLRQELDEGYSGPARAGRPLLLEGGLDWKSMGLSPREMDFAEAKNGAARDIALAFGVPPMLLGIPGDNTFANYQEANRAFFRLTVLPLISRTAASLAAWAGPAFGPEGGAGALRLEPDYDRIAGLSAERGELWARISAASFLSEEEKRQAVGY